MLQSVTIQFSNTGMFPIIVLHLYQFISVLSFKTFINIIQIDNFALKLIQFHRQLDAITIKNIQAQKFLYSEHSQFLLFEIHYMYPLNYLPLCTQFSILAKGTRESIVPLLYFHKSLTRMYIWNGWYTYSVETFAFSLIRKIRLYILYLYK